MTAARQALLDEASVPGYLVTRGVLADARGVTVTRLSGGVSNVVLRVASPHQDVVVKQALGRLRVTADWFADPGRAQLEALALQRVGTVAPDRVPAVLDSDPAAFAIVISCAPDDWHTWKAELMSGLVRPQVAVWLGAFLAAVHVGTAGDPPGGPLDQRETFRQLRLDPYLEATAERLPAVREPVLEVASQLAGPGRCLVLGDFSPKNILVGAAAAGWVIDLEVGHRGRPEFDLAFLATHLTLKRLHVGAAAPELRTALRAFVETYAAAAPAAPIDTGLARRILGCLLLARVLGRSPVEYLTPAERERVVTAGTELLVADAGSDDWWELPQW